MAALPVSAEIAGGWSAWTAAAQGREAALVWRKVRRLSMRSIIADNRFPDEQETRPANNALVSPSFARLETPSRQSECALGVGLAWSRGQGFRSVMV